MRLFLSFFLLVALALNGACEEIVAPWAQPREFSVFQFLLDRSPFSLPTAEESSPLAERFSLSGAVEFDGEALVFVLDRNDQTRHMLSKNPNQLNMSLVEYLPDPDPRKMRATIRVDDQVATIAYVEPINSGQLQADQQNSGMAPPFQPRAAMNQPRPAVNNPAIPPSPPPSMQPQNGGAPPMIRRTIRRRGISGQPIPGP